MEWPETKLTWPEYRNPRLEPLRPEEEHLARKTRPARIREILQSLEGHRLRDHHRRMFRLSLEHLAFLEQQIGTIVGEVLALIEREGYGRSFDLLQSIPGVQEISAAALLAETGADMGVFPTEGHPGLLAHDRWARTTLVKCAWAAGAG